MQNDGTEVYEVLSSLGYQVSDKNKLVGEAKGLHELCSSRRQHSSNLILIKCTCQECENQYEKRQVAIEYIPRLSRDGSNRKNEEIPSTFSIAQKLDHDIQDVS